MAGSSTQISEALWRNDRIGIAFAGNCRQSGTAMAPAVDTLRQMRPGARITWLWPAGAETLPTSAFGEQLLEYPAPETVFDARSRGIATRRAMEGLVGALAAERLPLLIIFTQTGHAPHVPAYVAYLAGIGCRAGISGEFGGAVLSVCIAPPPGWIAEAQRHLYLLDALGLQARIARGPAQTDARRR